MRTYLKARPIAVVPRRRGMDLDFALQFQLGDAAQILPQDLSLDFELMFVAGVLVVASAAGSKVRAGRRDAVRRGFQDGGGLSAGEAGFFFDQRRFDLFSGEHEGNEGGFAASKVFVRRTGRQTD